MIINGSSRAGARDLANEILESDNNKSVAIIETYSSNSNQMQGFLACLLEMESKATMTKGIKGLYYSTISPASGAKMTKEKWIRSADVLESKLKLTGQPRVIVKRMENDREHLHVVWQRTDTKIGKFIPDSFSYRSHEQASRQLEAEFGHEAISGAFTSKGDTQKKPSINQTLNDCQKTNLLDSNPKDPQELIRELFEQSGNGEAFRDALYEQGFLLAKGNRSPFVVVDKEGKTYALRSIFKKIYKAKEVYARIEDIVDQLPTVEN